MSRCQHKQVKAALKEVEQLDALRKREIQHYHNAVNIFLKDLTTLPGKGNAAPNPDMKSISDTYGEILAVNEKMQAALTDLAGRGIMTDGPLRTALMPIGSFNKQRSDSIASQQLGHVKGAAAAFAHDGPSTTNVFFAPQGVNQAGLEEMSSQLYQIETFKPTAAQMQTLAGKWDASVRSGISQ